MSLITWEKNRRPEIPCYNIYTKVINSGGRKGEVSS